MHSMIYSLMLLNGINVGNNFVKLNPQQALTLQSKSNNELRALGLLVRLHESSQSLLDVVDCPSDIFQ